MRVYNLREGLTAADDTLPERFFRSRSAGRPLGADCIWTARRLQASIRTYYRMMGWDDAGRPATRRSWMDTWSGWSGMATPIG